MSHVDALVTDYLQRLEDAAAGLPPDRRDELLDGIAEHISAAGPQDEVAVRTLLDRLGEPADIVAAAREDLPEARGGWAPAPRGTGHELAAVLLLTVGSFVPVVGWLAGVALLWTSTLWRLRDKVLGTLVVPLGPGGVLLAGAFLPLVGRSEVCTSGGTVQGEPGVPAPPVLPPPFPDAPPGEGSVEMQGVTCTTQGLDGWVSGLLVGVLLLAPVVVAVLLMRTARRRAADQPVLAPPSLASQPGAAWGGLELAGVLVLGLGGLLVPVVGPLVGLALVLSSRRWTATDKALAATLSVLPVLLPLARMALPGAFPIGLGGGELLLLGGLVIGPVLAAAYLAVVLQRRR